jgi:cation:H+ antiporter
MFISIILIFIGFVLLIKGADFLVDGASNIAKKFHIPEIIIGLTIVSIGTSMPELVVSVTSALDGHSDIAIGNVVGSNLSNLLLILGLCAVIKPLEFKRETRLIETPMTIVATVMFFIMCNTGAIVSRPEGFILLICFVLFVIYNIIMAKKGNEFDAEDGLEEKRSVEIIPSWKSLLYIIIGIVGLKIGGDFVVDNAVNIATLLGISETLISLTIVAISTSLPELVTSVTATRKGETDMAIGNILGSQLFNIILIIGTSSVVCPIKYDTSYNFSLLLLLVSSVMLAVFPYMGKKNYLGRKQGALYVTMYICYMFSLIFTNVAINV